jgi:hypothetical protein
MRYSWEKVNTRQACDALLAQAQVKKQRLERRRRNLGESIEVFRKRLVLVSEERIQVNSALMAFTAAHKALPEGKDKITIEIKIKRLEVRLAILAKKAYTYNVVALLARQMKYNLLDRQVWVMEHYIATVARIRLVLSRPALRSVQVAANLRSAVGREGENWQSLPKSYAEWLSPGVLIDNAVGLVCFFYMFAT